MDDLEVVRIPRRPRSNKAIYLPAFVVALISVGMLVSTSMGWTLGEAECSFLWPGILVFCWSLLYTVPIEPIFRVTGVVALCVFGMLYWFGVRPWAMPSVRGFVDAGEYEQGRAYFSRERGSASSNDRYYGGLADIGCGRFADALGVFTSLRSDSVSPQVELSYQFTKLDAYCAYLAMLAKDSRSKAGHEKLGNLLNVMGHERLSQAVSIGY